MHKCIEGLRTSQQESGKPNPWVKAYTHTKNKGELIAVYRKPNLHIDVICLTLPGNR